MEVNCKHHSGLLKFMQENHSEGGVREEKIILVGPLIGKTVTYQGKYCSFVKHQRRLNKTIKLELYQAERSVLKYLITGVDALTLLIHSDWFNLPYFSTILYW